MYEGEEEKGKEERRERKKEWYRSGKGKVMDGNVGGDAYGCDGAKRYNKKRQ